jgi:hypothetical protein
VRTLFQSVSRRSIRNLKGWIDSMMRNYVPSIHSFSPANQHVHLSQSLETCEGDCLPGFPQGLPLVPAKHRVIYVNITDKSQVQHERSPYRRRKNRNRSPTPPSHSSTVTSQERTQTSWKKYTWRTNSAAFSLLLSPDFQFINAWSWRTITMT